MGKFTGGVPSVASRVAGAMGTTSAPARGVQRGSGTPQGTHAGKGGPKPGGVGNKSPGVGLGTAAHGKSHPPASAPTPPRAGNGKNLGSKTATGKPSRQNKGATEAGYGNTSGFADSEL